MKTIKLILGVILTLAVLGFVGNYITPKKAYAQEKPSIEDLVGTWINEEMTIEKIVIKSDGTFLRYMYADAKFPNHTNMITIKDSWVDEKGNKYYKIYAPGYKLERLDSHHFDLMRINESGTVLEMNRRDSLEFYKSEYQDVPEAYPTEIDPNSYDFLYYIYYRQ